MFGLIKRHKAPPRASPRPGEVPALDAAVSDFRPVSRGQRRWIIVVSLATAIGLWLLLLYRPGGHPRVIPPAPAASATLPCPPGQTSGCVGGKAEVMLLPVQPASAPR